MASYKELLAQKASLESQIAAAHEAELSDAVQHVRAIVAEFDLTEENVFAAAKGKRASATSGTKVAAKYRDPVSIATWTGRGKAPKWIAEQDRSQFAIRGIGLSVR